MEAQVVLYSWRCIKHVTFGGDNQHKATEGLKTKLDVFEVLKHVNNRLHTKSKLYGSEYFITNTDILIFGLFYAKHTAAGIVSV